MLLHIRPRLFAPIREVALVDLNVDALRLHLTGNVDLVTRRPYPNKRFAVACRKQGRKAIDGILIETGKEIDEFHYRARWAIGATFIVTHHVHYKLLDHEFNSATDDMTCWYAYDEGPGGRSLPNRWPAWAKDFSPMQAEPLMVVIPNQLDKPCVGEEVVDEESGCIVLRRETFAMPTIERERLLLGNNFGDRFPPFESVFTASEKW